MRFNKVGGISFLRLGRVQMSFCVCRCSVDAIRYDASEYVSIAMIAVLAIASTLV